MALTPEIVRSSWRSWWSPRWPHDRGGPLWLQLVWTGLFNTAIALGMTLLAWSFVRRIDLTEALVNNLVISHCIGYTIHGLFELAGRVLGVERIAGFNWPQRVAFYSLLPITGVFIGYAVGLTLLGVDVVKMVAERPNLLVSIVLLSIVVSGFWYRYMANKSRLAEAEAERERARARALAAEKQALDAQLRALQAQIEPHFLFNTLANVVSLIDAAPGEARRMLERLIALLRASLSASRATSATLAQEVELLRAYLDILAIRMGRRLRFRIDVPAELGALPLPLLLLQPLVENAIKHGLEPKLTGGTVEVGARLHGDGFEITVVDDGLGFRPGPGAGVGLSNLRERLAALYGDAARLAIEDLQPGTRVRITLPRVAPPVVPDLRSPHADGHHCR
jgi:signal transduction histidine kinase